jgi:hypothetical protein
VSVAPAPNERRATDPQDLAAALGASDSQFVTVDRPMPRGQARVTVYVRDEIAWTGPMPEGFGSVPNKAALVLDGEPTYPELLVVRLLERAGWSAAWRKNWGGLAYWRDIREPISPPPMVLSIMEQVSRQAGHLTPWDIVAWRGRQVRFLVSRTHDGHPVGAYLANWMDAALRMGVPATCFAVVQHVTARRPRRR